MVRICIKQIWQGFLFNYKAKQCPIQIKKSADSKFKMAVMNPDFSSVEISTSNEGTHSMQKFATTCSSKDDEDLRVR